MHHHAFGSESELVGEERAVHRPDVVGVNDALGKAGGAAAVDDVVEVVVADLHRGWSGRALAARQLVVGGVAGPALGSDQDVALGRDEGELPAGVVQCVGGGGAGQHRGGIGVLQQGDQSGAPQQRTERDGHHAQQGSGPVGEEQLDAVGQDDREGVALAEPERQQGVGKAVHLRIEFTEGEAAFPANDREVLGAIARVARQQRADVHASPRQADGQPRGMCSAGCSDSKKKRTSSRLASGPAGAV